MRDKYIKNLVSVIIPAYNCEKYIEEAVESIENQEYKNIEIIICDDGSTDKTKDKINQLAKKYKNIIPLFNSKNLKIVKARNKCLEECNGEFITSQDADDYSEKSRLKIQVEFLKRHSEIGYVSCGMYKVDEKGKKIGKVEFNEKQITDKDFVKGSPAAHAPTMFRREVLEKSNGYRDDKITRCIEDYDLFFRLQILGIKGYLLSDILYYYRQDNNFKKRRNYKCRIDEYKIRKKYYIQLSLSRMERLYRFKPLIVGLIPKYIIEKIRK